MSDKKDEDIWVKDKFLNWIFVFFVFYIFSMLVMVSFVFS